MRVLGCAHRSRFAGILLLLVTLAGDAGGKPEAPTVLPLVRTSTWEALRARTPIRLPEGGWVRLGLERAALPPRSSGLLYALVGGGAVVPPVRALRDGARALGPLLFRTRSPAGVLVRGSAIREVASPESEATTERLYAATLVPSGGLPMEVEAFLHAGRVVAAGRIVPLRGPAHPWLSLHQSDPGVAQGVEGEKGSAAAALTLEGATWGAPDVDGMLPLVQWAGPQDQPAGALPTLEPARPDPLLGLEATRDGFVLTSVKALPVRWIADRLLYRLWVNEQPLHDTREVREVCVARSGGHQLEATRIRVRVNWELAERGVTRDDRVALQLLWCPSGWRDGSGRARLIVELGDPSQRPRMTPRVELPR